MFNTNKKNLLLEKRVNEDNAKKLIKNSGIFGNGTENEDVSTLAFKFLYRIIYELHCQRGNGSRFGYNHIAGLTRLVLENALKKIPSSSPNIYGTKIKMDEEGMPVMNNGFLFKLRIIISNMDKKYGEEDSDEFDRNFYSKSNGSPLNINYFTENFYNKGGISSYFQNSINNLKDYKIGESGNRQYDIYEIKDFETAKKFIEISPDLCYLKRPNKWEQYSKNGSAYLFIRKNFYDINKTELDKGEEGNKFDDFGLSVISVGTSTSDKIDGLLLAIQTRHSWHKPYCAGDSDLSIEDFQKVTGTDLRKMFNCPIISVNKNKQNIADRKKRKKINTVTESELKYIVNTILKLL